MCLNHSGTFSYFLNEQPDWYRGTRTSPDRQLGRSWTLFMPDARSLNMWTYCTGKRSRTYCAPQYLEGPDSWRWEKGSPTSFSAKSATKCWAFTGVNFFFIPPRVVRGAVRRGAVRPSERLQRSCGRGLAPQSKESERQAATQLQLRAWSGTTKKPWTQYGLADFQESHVL